MSSVISYIQYLLKSQNKHKIHSPFVYTLVAEVINKKKKKKDYQVIADLRKKLSKSQETITVTDFGAGSKINRSKTRKIKDIVQNSAKNQKFGELLYRFSEYYKPRNIVELGTSLGVSTCYLSLGNPNARIFTFEGCPKTSAIANDNFKKMNIKNISLTVGRFEDKLVSKLEEIKKIDMVFLDGNHQEKATLEYFEKCLKYSHNDTIFIFDDIHWSKGMENAWKAIQNHKKVSLTIDLFFVGIVFIKNELSKENFIIQF